MFMDCYEAWAADWRTRNRCFLNSLGAVHHFIPHRRTLLAKDMSYTFPPSVAMTQAKHWNDSTVCRLACVSVLARPQ
jgi:hypothetical protein